MLCVWCREAVREMQGCSRKLCNQPLLVQRDTNQALNKVVDSSRVPNEIENTNSRILLVLHCWHCILLSSQITSCITTSRAEFHAVAWKVNKVGIPLQTFHLLN